MARALIATDVRVHRAADGQWQSTHSTVSDDSMSIYGNRYSDVVLLARATSKAPASHIQLTGAVMPLQNNPSQRGLVSGAFQMWRAIRRLELDRSDLIVLRLPELVSFITWLALRKSPARKLVFVVAEPQAIAEALAPSFALRATTSAVARVCKRIVHSSDGVVYVTQAHLQKIVPPRPGQPVLARSNVRVPESQIASEPRPYDVRDRPLRVVAAGNQDGNSKGFDILLRAINQCRRQGHSLTCRILGEGTETANLRNLASELGLHDVVEFPGFISSKSEIFAELRNADLFAMPSRTEGLPRALIEAMSTGMAAIGSRAGGIPELLPPFALTDVEDVDGLAELLAEASSNPAFLNRSAVHSLRTARQVVEATSQETFDRMLDAVSSH